MNDGELPDDKLPFAALREAYHSAVPRDTAEEVARRAMMADSVDLPPRATGHRRRIGAFAAGLVTLAAAAVLITVIGRERLRPAAPSGPPMTASDSTSSTVAVEVPEGQNAIVLATKNPLISVVWFY
jgi:hypothetical protein